MTIYVINYLVGRDYYNGSDWEPRLDEEAGYFTDREDAQEWIDNALRTEYEGHCEFYEEQYQKQYDRQLAIYNQQMLEYNLLKDAGITKKLPVAPKKQEVQTYEQWLREDGGYEIVSLELGSADR